MYFRNAVLCKDLNQYEKIIIYGTGNFSQEIYPQLVKRGLKEKIVSFTQTEGDEPAFIDGIPVVNIERLNYNKKECVVLIAVSKLYVDEIKQILRRYEYPNIVSLVDYYLHYKFLEADYRYLTTFEEYYEYIADWYARNKKKGSNKKRELFRKIADIEDVNQRRKNLKQIVMICGHLSARTTKIAGALKRKKYDVIMLRCMQGGIPWCLEELQKVGVQIYQCNCITEMLYYALQYCPLVYFFEPTWGDCLWAEIMLKFKQHFGKVVLSLYDVLNDGYPGIKENKLATEKYALEHADGIAWRWFSKEYLEEKGFRYQGKSIQFLDYCYYEHKELVSDNLNSSVVKLCFVIGYGDEYFDERTYNAQYTDFAKLDEILACIGNKTECIFHFYVGDLSDKNIMRCKEYEEQYKNFKFFLGTKHNELLDKLSDYDYLCDLYIAGEEPDNDTLVGEYLGSSYRNSISNGHFDSLSVGLPIITTRAVKMWEYLSAYDIVIKMNLSNLDLDYLKQQRQYYRTEVKAAQRELDIDNQIVRLIQFFTEL